MKILIGILLLVIGLGIIFYIESYKRPQESTVYEVVEGDENNTQQIDTSVGEYMNGYFNEYTKD